MRRILFALALLIAVPANAQEGIFEDALPLDSIGGGDFIPDANPATNHSEFAADVNTLIDGAGHEEEAQIGTTDITGNAADDKYLNGTGANAAEWKDLPAGGTDGCSAAGDKPIYTASTNSWSCGTDGGGAEVNDLTAAVTWTDIPDGNVPSTHSGTAHHTVFGPAASPSSDHSSFDSEVDARISSAGHEEEAEIGTTTITGNAADDQYLNGTGAGAATWKALPAGGTDGCSAAGDKPIYTASTNSWSCGTDGGGGTHPIEAGDYAAGSIVITDIDDTDKTGSDAKLVTGTAAPAAVACAEWNAEGDLIESPTQQPCNRSITPEASDDSTLIATTAFVQTELGDYCLLAGCSMTGNIEFLDGFGTIFGTGGDASILHNDTNFLITNTTGNLLIDPGGLTDFTGAIFVAQDENGVYSQFGGAPGSANVSDAIDMLVVRKQRLTTNSQPRRAAMIVLDLDSNGSHGSTNFVLNAGAYTLEEGTYGNSKDTAAGSPVGGRYFIRHQGEGLIARAGGISALTAIWGGTEDGTITNGYGLMDEGGDGGAGDGEITNYRGFWVLDSKGNVTNKIGFHIESLTNASGDNIGIQLDGADTAALWFNNDTAASATMFWGTGKDVDLFRGGAGILQTTSSFVVGTDLTVTGAAHGFVDTKCTYIEVPVTDEEFESIWRAPVALTIDEIWCEADAGTVLADLEVDDGSPTGVNGSDITCDAPDGEADSALGGQATMVAGDRLDLDLGTVTTAVKLSVCWTFTTS